MTFPQAGVRQQGFIGLQNGVKPQALGLPMAAKDVGFDVSIHKPQPSVRQQGFLAVHSEPMPQCRRKPFSLLLLQPEQFPKPLQLQPRSSSQPESGGQPIQGVRLYSNAQSQRNRCPRFVFLCAHPARTTVRTSPTARPRTRKGHRRPRRADWETDFL